MIRYNCIWEHTTPPESQDLISFQSIKSVLVLCLLLILFLISTSVSLVLPQSSTKLISRQGTREKASGRGQAVWSTGCSGEAWVLLGPKQLSQAKKGMGTESRGPEDKVYKQQSQSP